MVEAQPREITLIQCEYSQDGQRPHRSVEIAFNDGPIYVKTTIPEILELIEDLQTAAAWAAESPA